MAEQYKLSHGSEKLKISEVFQAFKNLGLHLKERDISALKQMLTETSERNNGMTSMDEVFSMLDVSNSVCLPK